MRTELEAFAQKQEATLQENSNKPHWEDSSLHLILHDLERTVQKLHMAVCDNDFQAVCRGAVNVGNYAMMLHDNASKLIGQKRKKNR